MSWILTIIGSFLLLDVLCWLTLSRSTRHLVGRVVLAMFMSAQILILIWLVSSRIFQTGWDQLLPKFAVSAVFIWHFLGLAIFAVIVIALVPVLSIRKIARLLRQKAEPRTRATTNHEGAWTRREFLGFTTALAPAVFTFSLTGIALRQLSHFRVRRFELPIPKLPVDLDGLTIAHVSDIHVGRFTSGRVLREMIAAVNEMRADLVLLTGDLINSALSSLDDALDLVREIDPRSGLYLIEGNHDLIEDAAEFEQRVKGSGIPFLLDESAIVTVRGAAIQLLGLSWTRARKNRDSAIARAVTALLQQREPDAFPILLAHHPHAFDAAAEAALPLTLSGHTHGGQIMLNEQYGFGPAIFRYWSGLYERGPSKLIVSNGVGNWFPLRARAPAELVHITLRAA